MFNKNNHNQKYAVFFRSSLERCEYIAPVILQIEQLSSINITYLIYIDRTVDVDSAYENKLDNLRLFLNKLKLSYEIVDYKLPSDISDLILNLCKSKKQPSLWLALYESFKHLEHFDKIAILGTDLIVNDNILNLYNLASESHPVAYRKARRMIKIFSDCTYIEEKSGLKLKEEYFTPNGDVIVISNFIKNYKALTSECYDLLIACNNRLFHIDEDVLGLLFYKNNILAYEFDFQFNGHSTYEGKLSIIHTINHEKFWENYEDIGTLFPHFVIYYNLYCNIIQKTSEYKYTPSRIMLSYFYQKYWNAFYKEIFLNLKLKYDIFPNSLTNNTKYFTFFLNSQYKIKLAVELQSFPKFIYTTRYGNSFKVLNEKNQIGRLRIVVFIDNNEEILLFVKERLSNIMINLNFKEKINSSNNKSKYYTYDIITDYTNIQSNLNHVLDKLKI